MCSVIKGVIKAYIAIWGGKGNLWISLQTGIYKHLKSTPVALSVERTSRIRLLFSSSVAPKISNSSMRPITPGPS